MIRQGKKEYLEIANRQLRHLGELVESILAMSMERRKSMPLRPEKSCWHPLWKRLLKPSVHVVEKR